LPSVWHWVKIVKFEEKTSARKNHQIKNRKLLLFRPLVMFVQIFFDPVSDTWQFGLFFRHLVFI